MDIKTTCFHKASDNKVVRKMAGAARFALPAVLISVLAAAAHGATLYRYINDKGYQEIGYSIPTHLVANGYDVIDESGRLIRRVSPQLTEAEYAAKLEQERKLEACEKAIERVHRRYEALADIDAAEHLFEQQLQASLKNDLANLDYSRSKLSDQQETAAQMERSGKAIPKHLLANIQQTEQQIQSLTAQMDARKQNAEEKAQQFEEERRVFGLVDCNSEALASAR
jgi:hypothetical protein